MSNKKRKLDCKPRGASAKRLKPDQLTFKKHPQLWALDGNVLLQMDSTRFKLHQSRLAVQSPWFDKFFQRKAGVKVSLGDY